MNKPFMLRPAYKDYLWGGSRLNDDFRKDINCYPLAETWECSTHPDGQSVVSSGCFDGQSFGDVLKRHPDFLGNHSLRITGDVPELPILVKLIDAYKDLSVQVHPNDEYASKHEDSLGKTEMWYVLSARKDAKIVYGFNRELGREEVKNAVLDGSISKLLNYVPIEKDNVFFIEPGTVHAIGAGTLVAEIQENSNITYRLYDYDRVDKKGNKRELHIDKALDVANLSSAMTPRQPMRLLKYKNGCATELLGRCKYFQVERMMLNTEINRELVDYQTGSNSFHVLLCTEGCGVIFGEDVMINYFKGDTLFIPANSMQLKIHGKSQMLDISC